MKLTIHSSTLEKLINDNKNKFNESDDDLLRAHYDGKITAYQCLLKALVELEEECK